MNVLLEASTLASYFVRARAFVLNFAILQDHYHYHIFCTQWSAKFFEFLEKALLENSTKMLNLETFLMKMRQKDNFKICHKTNSEPLCFLSWQVWQLAQKGHIISHRYSQVVPNCLMNGVKFLDNKGAAFAITAYDSNRIQIFNM